MPYKALKDLTMDMRSFDVGPILVALPFDKKKPTYNSL